MISIIIRAILLHFSIVIGLPICQILMEGEIMQHPVKVGLFGLCISGFWLGGMVTKALKGK